MPARYRISIKQLLIATAIAAAVFAMLMRPTVTPTATLDSVLRNPIFEEIVVGGDISGRFITHGSVTVPKGYGARVGGKWGPLAVFTIDGIDHEFTQSLPGEYQHRIYRVKVIDTDEFRWLVIRCK